jgi:23S rRNA pseudouridine1911/1915/1917 synthase
MVAAKSDKAHTSLAGQIKNRTASRIYRAIVHGHIAEKQGVINAPIGRHPKDRKKMAVIFKNSKEAITYFSVKEYLSGNSASDKYTFVECSLKTGRTHQIRVHMAHIGHPVTGDVKYGGRNCFKIDGQALHSFSMKLNHPLTGEEMFFTAQLPDDMLNIYNMLKSGECQL